VNPAWPTQYGGPGWTSVQRYIWSEECAAADTIPILPFGINMVGPVIYTFGTPEQKAKFLPPTLSGDIWWCQGYSEPGAGSDLASLKTKAERQGDYYIVNGQKTWTTLAQHADWIFCLVRTDPTSKPQEGISFLLIDMKTPGITVRPIITLGGEHEVNEVWFEDVKVPVENRIYEENKGWTCAKFLLAHERSGIAGVARSKRGVERIKSMARNEQQDGRPLLKDPFFKRKVAELEIDLTALEYTELRTLASESAGKGPGPESSLLKIKGTEIQQRITELALEAAGHYGAPYFRGFPPEGDNALAIGPDYAHRTAPTYFNVRKTSIYGGSNEIQRNIIAKMVLGL
jgi:alkylation response protein AidB-like acyl-CoA dehydrogenase